MGLFNFSRALLGQSRFAFMEHLSEISLCMTAFFLSLASKQKYSGILFSVDVFLFSGVVLRPPERL